MGEYLNGRTISSPRHNICSVSPGVAWHDTFDQLHQWDQLLLGCRKLRAAEPLGRMCCRIRRGSHAAESGFHAGFAVLVGKVTLPSRFADVLLRDTNTVQIHQCLLPNPPLCNPPPIFLDIGSLIRLFDARQHLGAEHFASALGQTDNPLLATAAVCANAADGIPSTWGKSSRRLWVCNTVTAPWCRAVLSFRLNMLTDINRVIRSTSRADACQAYVRN